MYVGDERAKLPFRSLRSVPVGIIRTKSGTTSFRTQKEAMTPEKRLAVDKLLKRRVQMQDILPEEKRNRVEPKYINTLINSAFSNLRRAEEKQQARMDDFAENISYFDQSNE